MCTCVVCVHMSDVWVWCDVCICLGVGGVWHVMVCVCDVVHDVCGGVCVYVVYIRVRCSVVCVYC